MNKILSYFNYYKPGVGQSLGLLGWMLVGSLIGNGLELLIRMAFGIDAAMEYGLLFSYPCVFIPAIVYAALRSRRNRLAGDEGVEVDWHGFPGFRMGIEAILVTIAVGYIVDPLQMLLPEPPEWLKSMLDSVVKGNIVINLICASVMAPVFEEWFCRGMIMRGLMANGKSAWFAIIVSSLVFAFIHLNPWQAIPAFLLGCLFGFVYYRTGSLKITMLMHCANNTLAIVVSRIDLFNGADHWYDFFGPTAFWIIFAVLLVFFGFFIKNYR